MMRNFLIIVILMSVSIGSVMPQAPSSKPQPVSAITTNLTPLWIILGIIGAILVIVGTIVLIGLVLRIQEMKDRGEEGITLSRAWGSFRDTARRSFRRGRRSLRNSFRRNKSRATGEPPGKPAHMSAITNPSYTGEKQRKRPAPSICVMFQRNQCPFASDHEGYKAGMKTTLYHICQKCWTLNKVQENHSESSLECPYNDGNGGGQEAPPVFRPSRLPLSTAQPGEAANVSRVSISNNREDPPAYNEEWEKPEERYARNPGNYVRDNRLSYGDQSPQYGPSNTNARATEFDTRQNPRVSYSKHYGYEYPEARDNDYDGRYQSLHNYDEVPEKRNNGPRHVQGHYNPAFANDSTHDTAAVHSASRYHNAPRDYGNTSHNYGDRSRDYNPTSHYDRSPGYDRGYDRSPGYQANPSYDQPDRNYERNYSSPTAYDRSPTSRGNASAGYGQHLGYNSGTEQFTFKQEMSESYI